MSETKVVGSRLIYLWMTRFLSALLVLGGAGGTATCMLTIDQWPSQNWMNILQAVLPLILYLISFSAGVALWRGKDYGRLCAVILFSLQIPICSSTFFSYEWFTGISIRVINSGGHFSWSTEIGGADDFHLFSEFVRAAYGINLFAFCGALFFIISYRKSYQGVIAS